MMSEKDTIHITKEMAEAGVAQIVKRYSMSRFLISDLDAFDVAGIISAALSAGGLSVKVDKELVLTEDGK